MKTSFIPVVQTYRPVFFTYIPCAYLRWPVHFIHITWNNCMFYLTPQVNVDRLFLFIFSCVSAQCLCLRLYSEIFDNVRMNGASYSNSALLDSFYVLLTWESVVLFCVVFVYINNHLLIIYVRRFFILVCCT